MRKVHTLLFSALLFAAPALADGALDKIISPFDKARLADFAKTEAEALSQALRGDPAEVEILTAALSGKPMPLDGDFDPTGKWRCRVIKAGGDDNCRSSSMAGSNAESVMTVPAGSSRKSPARSG